MTDRNISNSALKIIKILYKLLNSDCEREVLQEDMSDDSFYIYLNTLRKAGFLVQKQSGNIYTLDGKTNLLKFDDIEITFLSKIKEMFSQVNNYKNIIDYNNFLLKLLKYTDKSTEENIKKIINAKPINLSMYKNIFLLEEHIKNKKFLTITYNSANLKPKTFTIFPLYLKLENEKFYLWGIDNTIEDLRCLIVNRILDIKTSNQTFDITHRENYAICEVNNKNYLKVFDENIIVLLKKENKSEIIKITFSNQFEFFQKVLSLGLNCKILESLNLHNDFKQIILNIGNKYE